MPSLTFIRIVARLVPLLLLTSCGYSERSYRGDGALIDHGWYSGSDRYVLDLGPVELTRSTSRQYRMANLPPERLVVGFEIVMTPSG